MREHNEDQSDEELSEITVASGFLTIVMPAPPRMSYGGRHLLEWMRLNRTLSAPRRAVPAWVRWWWVPATAVLVVGTALVGYGVAWFWW